jgi:hypothetical protein
MPKKHTALCLTFLHRVTTRVLRAGDPRSAPGTLLVAAALVFAAAGCPAPTTGDVAGRWQVSSVATAPWDVAGMIDSFQIDLLPDRTTELVPGSGFDLGIDYDQLELLEPWKSTYSVAGGQVRVTATYSIRYQGVHYAYTQLWELRQRADGSLGGSRTTSIFSSGLFVGSIRWDESWSRVGKSGELLGDADLHDDAAKAFILQESVAPEGGDFDLMALIRLGRAAEAVAKAGLGN